MIIEIHAPELTVHESVVASIEKKLLALSHLGEKISRAEVQLSEENRSGAENKTCKITLTLVGESLFVNKHARSFGQAANAAIKVLKRRLIENLQSRTDFPEDIITTVDPESEI